MRTTTALLYSLTVDRVLAGIRSRVPEVCGMQAGDRVLDVCCGTGAQNLRCARIGVVSCGIDLDPVMIAFAEKRRRRLGLDHAHFQRASAAFLPFKDGSFDHASVSMGLHEKEEALRDRIISEMRRVVKKGGTLMTVDYTVPFPAGPYGQMIRMIEWAAGRAHFRCFQEYVRDGGLDSLTRRHGLQGDESDHAGRMPISIVKVRNSRGSDLP
ncbi:MAG: class I SAM-dependent methyltransferase [Dehalococcoidia bacterium]|nr:class I SAM-dependent methyltransferase [Dehalococcoidia bacterium]